MICRFIEAEKETHGVSGLCRTLGVSRSGFYAWLSRGLSDHAASDVLVAAEIAGIHTDSDGTYGAPRIHAELRGRGIRVSRRRVARLMREQGLEGVSRRRRRRSLTRTDPAASLCPDRVGRRFTAAGPDQLWYADITYVPTWQGWLYVALVVDGWSRRIIGWSMRDTLEAELVVDAVGMATLTRRPTPATVHHSDRGSQYTSTVFGRTLRESGIAQSMGRTGSALDNAACESVMASFKTELVHRRSFQSRDHARRECFTWIEGWYNPRRRHSALGYLSPVEFENQHGPCGPVDPAQPALEGALAGVEPPSNPNRNLSTKPR